MSAAALSVLKCYPPPLPSLQFPFCGRHPCTNLTLLIRPLDVRELKSLRTWQEQITGSCLLSLIVLTSLQGKVQFSVPALHIMFSQFLITSIIVILQVRNSMNKKILSVLHYIQILRGTGHQAISYESNCNRTLLQIISTWKYSNLGAP